MSDNIEVPEPTAARRQFVSDVIAELLAQLGYAYAPLNPGASFRGLHDSLVNYLGNRTPKVLLCTHEEIAVSIAHGYAKASRKPALAVVHDLVGLMHASMAVYDAWCDRIPLLVLGGAGPADPAARRWIDNVHSASSQADLVRPFVKWDDEPMTAQAIIDAIVRGYVISNTEPTGPVYISIDKALQEAPIPPGLKLPDLNHGSSRPAPPPQANPAAVARAADLLVEAKFPLIVAGRVGYDPAAGRLLAALAEMVSAGYHDHPDYVSFPTMHPHNLNGDPRILAEADVALIVDVPDVGETAALYPDIGGRSLFKDTQPKRIIDLALNEYALRSWTHLGGAASPAELRLLAAPLEGLRQLLEAVGERVARLGRARFEERAARIRALHAEIRQRQQAEAQARKDAPAMSSSWLLDTLWDAVKGNPFLLAGRALRGWAEGVWQLSGPGEFLGGNIGGGIGYGPGAAVGAALAARERSQLTVAILGDGDLIMAPGALWTAVHYRVPLLIVIDNNRSFLNDEEHQRRLARIRERPPSNAWIGTALRDPEIDFAALSRSFGAWAKGPITKARELPGAMAEAVEAAERGHVAVLDVRTARP